MVIRLTLVIMLKHIEISNHCFVTEAGRSIILQTQIKKVTEKRDQIRGYHKHGGGIEGTG